MSDLVADVAEVAEELVVVRLAVGEPLPLVVLVPQERLLALGAHKVLHVPMLACWVRNMEIVYLATLTSSLI